MRTCFLITLGVESADLPPSWQHFLLPRLFDSGNAKKWTTSINDFSVIKTRILFRPAKGTSGKSNESFHTHVYMVLSYGLSCRSDERCSKIQESRCQKILIFKPFLEFLLSPSTDKNEIFKRTRRGQYEQIDVTYVGVCQPGHSDMPDKKFKTPQKADFRLLRV